MSEAWYIKKGEKEYGPYSADTLREYAAQGKIVADTQIRQGKEGRWYSAGRVKGLAFHQQESHQSAEDAVGATPKEDKPQSTATNKEELLQFARDAAENAQETPGTSKDELLAYARNAAQNPDNSAKLKTAFDFPDVYPQVKSNVKSLENLREGLLFVLVINAFGLLIFFVMAVGGELGGGVAGGAFVGSAIAALTSLWIVIRAVAATSCHLKLQANISKQLSDILDVLKSQGD